MLRQTEERSTSRYAPVRGLLVVTLLLAFSRIGITAQPAPAGVPHFSGVNEHVFRGGQPSQKGFRSLETVGVRAVIDLRQAGSRSAREELEVEALGMKYYSVPLPALAAPSDEKVGVILALISDSNNWPVFIHCQRGRDRTGTVVACYRIEHDGWPNERALTEAIDNGLNGFEQAMRNYILHYKPATVSAAAKSGTQ